jgi:glycosyltransferase involved in cell wall biosynthesis
MEVNYKKSYSFLIYRLNNLRQLCISTCEPHSSITFKIMDPLLNIEFISPKYNITVHINGKVLDYPKGNITKVLYGTSEGESVNVTSPITSYLCVNNIIDRFANVNSIIGDPYPLKPKKLFIYIGGSSSATIVISELNNKLSANLLLLGGTGNCYQQLLPTKSEITNIRVYLISHQMDYSGAPIYLCGLKDFFDSFGYRVTLITKHGGNLSMEYPAIQLEPNSTLIRIMNDCFDFEKYKRQYPDISKLDRMQLIHYATSYGIEEKRQLYFRVPVVIFCNTIVTFDYVNKLSKLGIPVYWIIHECQRDYFFKTYNSTHLCSAFRNATSVINLCSAVRNVYSDVLHRDLIIYGGLDLNLMERKYKQDLFNRSHFGVLDDDIILCIVGQIQARKRQIPFIVDVFSKLIICYPNIRLLLVGQFVQNMKGIFNNIDPSIRRYIICRGEVKNTIPFIKASDIYICYSDMECLPITNFEAMFCRKPIVTTNVFGIREQLTHEYDALLFEPDCSDVCYKYIEKLINSKQLRNQLGSNARKTLVEKFDRNITFKRYIELIKDSTNQ